MSLGEERIYQMLWESGESADVYVESATSKKFSLGYDRIARLVRLNEKSVRLLLPKLIAKKILEVVAAEDSANQVGRTYRIFGQEEIVERQRAANLTHVVKSGRAVEFVWPISVGETPTAVVEPQQQRRTV
jgi:predicted ArsR family transcriptional regulator